MISMPVLETPRMLLRPAHPRMAGTVLAFARALGEYDATSMIAGYTPGKNGNDFHSRFGSSTCSRR